MLAIAMDTTARKLAEEAQRQLNATLERRVAERTEELASSNERLRAIMDSALIGILTLDAHGRIESANPAALGIFGYAPDEILGRNISRLMASPHPERHEDFLERYLRAGEKQLVEPGSQSLGRRKDGRVFPLDLALAKFTARRRSQFVAMARDITERKRLERELLDISERERQRIGHELHDGLGQHLHGLYYLAERTRELYHVDCRFQCPGSVLIHRQSAANHLYRIAQGALNNAMKHARPTRIDIQLEAKRQRIVLQIRDNGVGIPKRPGRLPGMGLRIMQYRAEVIRGSLLVQKLPQGGTAVVCTVPRQGLNHPDAEGK